MFTEATELLLLVWAKSRQERQDARDELIKCLIEGSDSAYRLTVYQNACGDELVAEYELLTAIDEAVEG